MVDATATVAGLVMRFGHFQGLWPVRPQTKQCYSVCFSPPTHSFVTILAAYVPYYTVHPSLTLRLISFTSDDATAHSSSLLDLFFSALCQRFFERSLTLAAVLRVCCCLVYTSTSLESVYASLLRSSYWTPVRHCPPQRQLFELSASGFNRL